MLAGEFRDSGRRVEGVTALDLFLSLHSGRDEHAILPGPCFSYLS